MGKRIRGILKMEPSTSQTLGTRSSPSVFPSSIEKPKKFTEKSTNTIMVGK